MKKFSIEVNGRAHQIRTEPEMPLLCALRNDLDLKGPRFGCGLGQCGACTVLLNGRAVRSCITPISEVGKRVVTILEGLGSSRPRPLQQAFKTPDSSRQLFSMALGAVAVGWLENLNRLAAYRRLFESAGGLTLISGLYC